MNRQLLYGDGYPKSINEEITEPPVPPQQQGDFTFDREDITFDMLTRTFDET